MHAKELLIRGEHVPDQMIARMLDMKMRSPEVAHHGLLDDENELCFSIFVFIKVIFWMDFQSWMKM